MPGNLLAELYHGESEGDNTPSLDKDFLDFLLIDDVSPEAEKFHCYDLARAQLPPPQTAKGNKRPPPPSPPQPSRLAPWYPALGAVAVAVLLAFLAKALAPPVHFLSTYNRSQMKEVFLGKGTWAVLCSGEGAGYDAVYKRFGTASSALKGSVKFGVVDCSGSLPSGKSILQKFELSEDVQPVLFVTGAGMSPVQASARNMDTHASLLKWVRVTAMPGASPVKSTRDLESKCLKKERCALIMKAGLLDDRAKDAFKELMARHRNLKFVSIDSTTLETSIEKKLGLKPFHGSHLLLHFTRYNITNPKVGTPRWGLQVYDGAMETDPMSVFLEEAATAEAKQNTPLTRLPTVMARKVPKVKTPPPVPPTPRPEEEATERAAEETAVGTGNGQNSPSEYGGLDKERVLEMLKQKQAEREAAKRRAMDEEADNFLFMSADEEGEGGEAERNGVEAWDVEWDGEGYGGEEDEGDEEEDFVDLDAL